MVYRAAGDGLHSRDTGESLHATVEDLPVSSSLIGLCAIQQQQHQ